MPRGAKPVKPKAGARPAVASKSANEDSRVRDLEKRLAEAVTREAEALKRESEALEQQTATAEILRVISSSPTDVQPVFDAIARHAVALCGGVGGIVVRYDGTVMRLAAYHNVSAKARELHDTEYPRAPDRTVPLGAAIADRTIVHVPNLQTSTRFAGSPVQRSGRGSMIAVPLLCHGKAIGAIGIARDKPQGFSDRDIALLETFADQAVIAIENVRLFNETNEALEQQTGTGDILRVIASSPTDVQPVFDAIVRTGAHLCEADFALLARYDGTSMSVAAHSGATAEEIEVAGRVYPMRPTPETLGGRAILERAVVHIPDVRNDPTYGPRMVKDAGWRTGLGVPLLREGAAIGAVGMWRRDVRPFSDRQIALLRTFADQAVIAIENVRLFKELEERNRALIEAHSQVTEALEQQTVTADILKVISRSPTNARPVFDAILRNAVALCGAELAGMFRFDGELVHMGATYNWSKEALEYFSTVYPSPPSDSLMSGRTILSRSIVQITDAAADPHYDPDSVATGHWRRMLGVPLLRGHDPLGALVVAWRDPGETPQRHVELLQTFAGQAVIAIENVRLFRELEVANGELAAASQHKSEFLANMSHELRTPLNAIIGYSELLEEEAEELDGGRLVPDLQKIATAAKHQLSLINDILDLSKVEAGRMELELSDFDLTTTLDSALTLVHERAGRRGIALQMEVDSRVGQVRGDERKVRQVVLNLLSNAIKFTPEGGRIEVRAARTDGSVEVSVSDTGIGIAPEDQEKVFEEFRQVGAADKKVEGTGLGLALARRFVELHGGRIWVNSQIERGATFTFTLPVGGGG